MNKQIKRGRALLLTLLSACCLIFFVNIFYPLYLSTPEVSPRYFMFFFMLIFAALAYIGIRGMRAAISGVLFILALFDCLVLFAALAAGRLGLSLAIAGIIFVHVFIGWLLLTSGSIGEFEAAQRQRPAKI